MTLKKCGKNISNYEISNINSNGIWIILNDFEYFINFKDFPEFKKANLDDIFLFEYNEPDHLYWEKLDIDIELDSLKNPERFPLKFKKLSSYFFCFFLKLYLVYVILVKTGIQLVYSDDFVIGN